jgi:D-alanine-D-alanine ligase
MNIAIITGGETGEREVSIRSANNVKNLIDFAETTLFTFPADAEQFIASAKKFDLAIPMIHGLGGEDGSIQGLFRNLNIPFLFSDITTHAIALDKVFTKEIVASLGITSPKQTKNFPLFCKPRNGGSSVSSKLCQTQEELDALIAANPGITFLMEEPAVGREFTVGIIDTGTETIPLPVVEIIPKGKFFDFESKYDPAKLASEICPAEIDSTLSQELQRQALLVHTHLNARHLSRTDFIVTKDNTIYFLEINTIPGMTNTSLIPKMVSTAGLSMKEIVKTWCSK